MYILFAIIIMAVALFLISLRPATFKISRSVTINAPAAKPFALVNDFHKWEAWSPWEKVDPNTKRTYGGSPHGVGTTYAWEGNRNVGSGNMKITESTPGELVRLDIDFDKPMKANNIINFTFVEQGGTTTLTQSMSGCNSLMGKAMGLFMNMDTMVGSQFEKGLAEIKKLSEAH